LKGNLRPPDLAANTAKGVLKSPQRETMVRLIDPSALLRTYSEGQIVWDIIKPNG
jgi:hypothetical protein